MLSFIFTLHFNIDKVKPFIATFKVQSPIYIVTMQEHQTIPTNTTVSKDSDKISIIML